MGAAHHLSLRQTIPMAAYNPEQERACEENLTEEIAPRGPPHGGHCTDPTTSHQNRQAGKRPVLDGLGHDLTEEGCLGAVDDFDLGKRPCQTRVAFEDDDPVTRRAAHELDGAGRMA